MKLKYYITVDVVTHVSKLKGVAEMINKTKRIKKDKAGLRRLQVLRSSHLLISWGLNVPVKPIKLRTLAFGFFVIVISATPFIIVLLFKFG